MRERVFLEGKRIYLRALEQKDLQGSYLNWFDDEEVCRWNSHHRFPYSESEAAAYIESLKGSRDKIVLAVIEKSEKVHIGNVSLQDISYLHRKAEFAVLMGERAYWGKGYAKEAGALLINHGFNMINLNRIYCETLSENIGMQKLALSLGFKEEGRKREDEYKHGKYNDAICFGLLRSEWNISEES